VEQRVQDVIGSRQKTNTPVAHAIDQKGG
jgi:hypothetical protein